jgi:putative IMPACT (imprinted ancient) family translation regulator
MTEIKYKNINITIINNIYKVTTHRLDIDKNIYYTIIEEFDNLNDAKDYIDAKIIIDKYMY